MTLGRLKLGRLKLGRIELGRIGLAEGNGEAGVVEDYLNFYEFGDNPNYTFLQDTAENSDLLNAGVSGRSVTAIQMIK